MTAPVLFREAIVPRAMRGYYRDWRMSPALRVGETLYLTGFTGAGPDGSIAPDPETQMRVVFEKIGVVLGEAGCGYGALADMTSYHKNIQATIELFRRVRAEYVSEPYPAWTAIEVSGFVHPRAIVEVRAMARLD